MYGWSFSAISWAASRGCSFCGPAREVDDLADRHEAADAAVDDEAALVVVDDRGVDDRPRLEQLLHRAPLALEAGAAEREDDVALGRLRLEHVHEDDVADAELRLRLGVAAVELAVADDAFRLRADVDQDLVLVDAHDRAFDHVAVLEALDVGVLLGEQLLHRRGLGAGRPRGDGGQLVLGLDVRRGRRVGRLVLRGCRCLDGLVGGCGGSLGYGGGGPRPHGPRRRRRPRPRGLDWPPRARRRRRPRRPGRRRPRGPRRPPSRAPRRLPRLRGPRSRRSREPLRPPRHPPTGRRSPRLRWWCPARGWSRGRRARRPRRWPRRSARTPGHRWRPSPPAPARSRPAARRSR